MMESSAIRCMQDIERMVLSEVAVATLDFTCPHCGCVLRIPLDQARIPQNFPCGTPIDHILTTSN